MAGRVELIQQLTDYLQRKRRELSSAGNRQQKKGRALDKRSSKSERVTAVDPLQRVMVLADATGKLQLDPVPDLPFLIELIGESAVANGECPFMLPLAKLDKIQTALSKGGTGTQRHSSHDPSSAWASMAMAALEW